MLALDPRFLAARSQGAPATSGHPSWESPRLMSNDSAPIAMVWYLGCVALCSGILLTTISPYLRMACGSLNEAHVTEENRYRLFVLYMGQELRMPGRNREAVLRSLSTLVALDAPFLFMRMAATVSLRVVASPWAAKNLLCIVYYMYAFSRFHRWRKRVKRLRSEHREVVEAFDEELIAATKGNGVAGSQMRVYERVGQALDAMDGPQAEFLEIFFDDILGLPVAAAAAADRAEDEGLIAAGWRETVDHGSEDN